MPNSDLAIHDDMERRAICLKFAIETKGVAFSLKNDATSVEAARDVLAAARMYEDYVTGDQLGPATRPQSAPGGEA